MRDALKNVKLFVVNNSVSAELEVTNYISEWIRRHRYFPTFIFNNIKESPGFSLVMNLIKRETILNSLSYNEKDIKISDLSNRLNSEKAEILYNTSLAKNDIDSVLRLPVLKHQPREGGRYLTSFVGSLVDPGTGMTNLGFYRALVKDDKRLVIFMDQRTDAYKIVKNYGQNGIDAPITLFNGGPPVLYLAAAANVPSSIDSYAWASKLSASPITIDETAFPSAPFDAEIVIHGRILRSVDREGPFGEFKGYYCEPTISPVLEIDSVEYRDQPTQLGIFCGKESGLTLMSLPNELLMYQHFASHEIEVEDIQYPLDGLGEFITLIQYAYPSKEILDIAMKYDKRTKMIVVAQDISNILNEMTIYELNVHSSHYIKRGEKHGSRLGIIVDRTKQYDWVEY